MGGSGCSAGSNPLWGGNGGRDGRFVGQHIAFDGVCYMPGSEVLEDAAFWLSEDFILGGSSGGLVMDSLAPHDEDESFLRFVGPGRVGVEVLGVEDFAAAVD